MENTLAGRYADFELKPHSHSFGRSRGLVRSEEEVVGPALGLFGCGLHAALEGHRGRISSSGSGLCAVCIASGLREVHVVFVTSVQLIRIAVVIRPEQNKLQYVIDEKSP